MSSTKQGTTITMPKLGESVTEGTLGSWLKKIGDSVEKYEPLVEVVTDKVTAEIPAPVSGTIVAIVGDGSAGYHLSEMETATRLGLPIVVVVGNDARWGTEWFLQMDRFGPGRQIATDLAEARYDIAAAGFGAAGYDIHYLGDLEAALSRALRTELPVLINVRVRPERSPVLVRH